MSLLEHLKNPVPDSSLGPHPPLRLDEIPTEKAPMKRSSETKIPKEMNGYVMQEVVDK